MELSELAPLDRHVGMSVYSITLFVHIAAVAGLFVASGLEATAVARLRHSSSPEQARLWLPLAARASRIGGPSMIVVLLSGFFMARASWHRLAWLEVTVGTVVAIIAIGATITGPRLRAIARAITAGSGSIASIAGDPLLPLALQTRTAMTVGIVFLMTVKPGLRGSLLTIAAAAFLGMITAVPGLRTRRIEE